MLFAPKFKHGDVHSIGCARVRLEVRPRSRRIALRFPLDADEAVASAPRQALLGEALAFARTREAWLNARAAQRPRRTLFAPGLRLQVQGEPLMLVASGRGAARRLGDSIVAGGEDGAAFARRIEAYLKRTAKAELERQTEIYAARLGHPAPKVSITDARTRWGSCSPHRCAIRYSWRLILSPPEVLSYVAAHECAHLVHANHSPDFWAVVERISPNYRAARSWLKQHGGQLFAFGAA